MGEFMREHEAANSGCAKVRSLQYLQTWQMIVLITFLNTFDSSQGYVTNNQQMAFPV